MTLASDVNVVELAQVITAAGTLVLAGIVGYIAYLQYRTEKLRLQHELYDRRLAVFTAAKQAIRKSVARTGATSEMVDAFLAETAQAEFLFGEEVPAYLGEVATQLVEIEVLSFDLFPSDGSTPVGGAERTELLEKHRAVRKWLMTQHERLHAVFRPYLDVGWVKGGRPRRAA